MFITDVPSLFVVSSDSVFWRSAQTHRNMCSGFRHNCFTKIPNKPNMFGFVRAMPRVVNHLTVYKRFLINHINVKQYKGPHSYSYFLPQETFIRHYEMPCTTVSYDEYGPCLGSWLIFLKLKTTQQYILRKIPLI